MSDSYIGEIRMFAGNYAPAGWLYCDGSLLPISEYEALFNLIGTTYGGDGQTTFALPDLRGRLPLHVGSGYALGQAGGVETVTLMTSQVPAHSHAFAASSSPGGQSNPQNNVLATSTKITLYHDGAPAVAMNAVVVGTSGGSQPHNNLQPYVCVNFIISIYGIYPSQS